MKRDLGQAAEKVAPEKVAPKANVEPLLPNKFY